MDIKKDFNIICLVLALLLVISLIFNIVFYVKLSKAEALSGNVLNFLSFSKRGCDSEFKDFAGVSGCIEKLILQLQEKPALLQMSFTNYYAGSLKGALVLKNIGSTNFDGTKFKLYLNKELQDTGCELKDVVIPQQTCALYFQKTCNFGDILDVEYDSKVVMSKTC